MEKAITSGPFQVGDSLRRSVRTLLIDFFGLSSATASAGSFAAVFGLVEDVFRCGRAFSGGVPALAACAPSMASSGDRSRCSKLCRSPSRATRKSSYRRIMAVSSSSSANSRRNSMSRVLTASDSRVSSSRSIMVSTRLSACSAVAPWGWSRRKLACDRSTRVEIRAREASRSADRCFSDSFRKRGRMRARNVATSSSPVPAVSHTAMTALANPTLSIWRPRARAKQSRTSKTERSAGSGNGSSAVANDSGRSPLNSSISRKYSLAALTANVEGTRSSISTGTRPSARGNEAE